MTPRAEIEESNRRPRPSPRRTAARVVEATASLPRVVTNPKPQTVLALEPVFFVPKRRERRQRRRA
jgi:hypothetical protein